MTKGLISKGIKKGTKSRERGLRSTQGTATNKVTLAPKDGGVLETMELFQQKFRQVRNQDGKDDNDSRNAEDAATGQRSSKPCIMPSGWGKRLKKPGKVHKYSKGEVAEYNIVLLTDGPEAAKAWADRRWHEREST